MKDLNKLIPIVVIYKTNSQYIEEASIIWRKTIPENMGRYEYLTISEAAQRGLNLEFLTLKK